MTFLSLSTSSQPFAWARYSNVCSVNELPGAVASVMPATPFLPFSACAAFWIVS